MELNLSRVGGRFVSGALAGFLAAAVIAGSPGRAAPADEIDRLITLTKPPARYQDHRPDFAAVEEEFSFESELGATSTAGKPIKRALWAIKDGQRYVAVYHPKASKVYVVAPSPERAPRKLKLPSAYNDAGNTFDGKLGVRLTTFSYTYGFIQANPRHFEFTGGGEKLTLTDTTIWPDARKAESVVALTFGCDPVLGYVVEMVIWFKTKQNMQLDKPGRLLTPELVNFYPNHTFMRKMPGATWRYERTIYTPLNTDKYVGWVNDFSQSDHADRLQVRNGGFLAFLADPQGTGPALTRNALTPNIRLINQTCNLQYDQHYLVTLPEKPGADGLYAVSSKNRLVFLPPELTQYILNRVEITDWHGNDAFALRLGQTEGFEQDRWPKEPLYKKGYRVPRLSDRQAHSGRRSLELRSKQRVRVDPQPVLEPNATYRLSAWMKVDGDGWALIESTPSQWVAKSIALKTERSRGVNAGDGWKQTTLELTNGPLGMTAWQFLVITGNGTAWVDDVQFVRVK